MASDNVLHAISGAGGGVLSMLLTYPLITLSTRSQVESKRAQSTVSDAVRKIIQREGVSGLYAGLESALFGISVTNFVYYYWYEWSRAAFESASLKSIGRHRKLSTLESMAAGAIAGSATVMITNPIWVVNTRMTARTNIHQEEDAAEVSSKEGEEEKKPESALTTTTTIVTSPPSPSSSSVLPTLQDPTGKRVRRSNVKPSTLGTIKSIIQKEGLSAFFAGVIPALILVINPILQYTIFEQMKNILERRRRRAFRTSGGTGGSIASGITPTDAFYLGAISKLVATGLTYPYITVKSRMHVAGGDKEKKYSMVKGIRRIIKEEGWSGLYNGVGPKLLQSVITAALLFAFKDALYGMTKKMMETRANARVKLLKKV